MRKIIALQIRVKRNKSWSHATHITLIDHWPLTMERWMEMETTPYLLHLRQIHPTTFALVLDLKSFKTEKCRKTKRFVQDRYGVKTKNSKETDPIPFPSLPMSWILGHWWDVMLSALSLHSILVFIKIWNFLRLPFRWHNSTHRYTTRRTWNLI